MSMVATPGGPVTGSDGRRAPRLRSYSKPRLLLSLRCIALAMMSGCGQPCRPKLTWRRGRPLSCLGDDRGLPSSMSFLLGEGCNVVSRPLIGFCRSPLDAAPAQRGAGWDRAGHGSTRWCDILWAYFARRLSMSMPPSSTPQRNARRRAIDQPSRRGAVDGGAFSMRGGLLLALRPVAWSQRRAMMRVDSVRTSSIAHALDAACLRAGHESAPYHDHRRSEVLRRLTALHRGESGVPRGTTTPIAQPPWPGTVDFMTRSPAACRRAVVLVLACVWILLFTTP